MSQKKLSETNKEILTWQKSILAELLPDLYFWSGADFDDWTIGELIGLIQEQLYKKETET